MSHGRRSTQRATRRPLRGLGRFVLSLNRFVTSSDRSRNSWRPNLGPASTPDGSSRARRSNARPSTEPAGRSRGSYPLWKVSAAIARRRATACGRASIRSWFSPLGSPPREGHFVERPSARPPCGSGGATHRRPRAGRRRVLRPRPTARPPATRRGAESGRGAASYPLAPPVAIQESLEHRGMSVR